MRRSLAHNAAYNMIYQLLNALFPLISAGYAARILTPEGVGKVASAQNTVSYFVMLAVMGIPAYGTREVARLGENRQGLDRLFSELFWLNICSTGVAVVSYFLLSTVCFSDSLVLYAAIGLELVFNFINIDWFYQGREEYGYITVRSLLVKGLSLAALFLFVRQKQDYIVYALIHSLGIGLNYCFNVFHAKKTVSLCVRNLNLKRHFKPVLYLMLSIVTASLYNKVDITMLSAMKDADSVAFYTNAHKVIGIILTLVTAVSAVFLPRLSYCYLSDRQRFEAYLSDGVKIVLLLAIPACIGVILVAEDMMWVLFGEAFVPAANVLRILAIFTVIKGAGDLLCYQAIISSGNERMLILARIAAGMANMLLNALLIPKYGANGAAIASVAAELVVNGILLWRTLSIIDVHIPMAYIISLCLSGVGMGAIVALTQNVMTNRVLSLIMSVLAGMISYAFLLTVTRNEVSCHIFKDVRKSRNSDCGDGDKK